MSRARLRPSDSGLPPWYRTYWAYGLYVLTLYGLLYGGHRFRVNHILREQRIRNRIASDLHDEVSATLSSITYFARAIRQSKNGAQSDRFVELISESENEAKEKITDIVWSIDPEHDDWINLLSKCRRYASDLLESKGIDYELDIDTNINAPLDLELRQQLWLIFKEMVINATRHSDAGKVKLQFGIRDGDRMKLTVQDDGVGIPEKEMRRNGHGLRNIQKRARMIGADLHLETDRDFGTRWELTLVIK
ncbi:MAG: histidine kinase [Balneolaceae bacterium]|nr:histidine kinase [Balneolaceae bacterium]